MRNSDETIEKVLTGLRDVDAPAGMERRILEGLEERGTARAESAKGWLGAMPIRGGMRVGYAAWGIALAGILVVVLAVPAIRKVGHAPVGSKAAAAPGIRAAVASSGTTVMGSATSREHIVRGKKEPGGISLTDFVGDSTVDSEDSLAMSETRAASFPAPTMPLTDQERLFLRMTHRGDAVELAVLDPHLRELEEREEKAEFQRFFAKPPLAATEGERSLPGQPLPGQPEDSAIPQAAAEQATPEPVAPEQASPDVETPKQTSPDSLGMNQSTPQETVTKAPQRTAEER